MTRLLPGLGPPAESDAPPQGGRWWRGVAVAVAVGLAALAVAARRPTRGAVPPGAVPPGTAAPGAGSPGAGAGPGSAAGRPAGTGERRAAGALVRARRLAAEVREVLPPGSAPAAWRFEAEAADTAALLKALARPEFAVAWARLYAEVGVALPALERRDAAARVALFPEFYGEGEALGFLTSPFRFYWQFSQKRHDLLFELRYPERRRISSRAGLREALDELPQRWIELREAAAEFAVALAEDPATPSPRRRFLAAYMAVAGLPGGPDPVSPRGFPGRDARRPLRPEAGARVRAALEELGAAARGLPGFLMSFAVRSAFGDALREWRPDLPCGWAAAQLRRTLADAEARGELAPGPEACGLVRVYLELGGERCGDRGGAAAGRLARRLLAGTREPDPESDPSSDPDPAPDPAPNSAGPASGSWACEAAWRALRRFEDPAPRPYR